MANRSGEKNAPNTDTDYSFVRALSALTVVEKSDLKEVMSGFLLPIDADRVFDLHEWYHTSSRSNNRYPARDEQQNQTLKDDIAEIGILVKPVLDQDTGEVVDGRHRLTALYEHRESKTDCPFPGFELRKFASLSDMHDFQDRIALQSRRLNRKQMAEIIKDAIKRHADWADNRIGCLLNVDGDTVKRHRDILSKAGEDVNSKKRLGADGRETAARKSKTAKSKIPQNLLLETWLNEFSTYPVSSGNIAYIMETVDYILPPDKQVTSANSSRLLDDIGKHVRKLAGDGITFNGYQVYVRAFGQGVIAFGLVAKKIRKPELESISASNDEADVPSK